MDNKILGANVQNAFDAIQAVLSEELESQGFKAPEPLEYEDGKASIMKTDEVAYSIVYDSKRQRFELRSTTLNGDEQPTEWRSLSLWLFDEKEGSKADADSIGNDFLEVVKGPSRVEYVMKKQKRGKGEDRNVDPVFFFNRLVNTFPEIKAELNDERIMYGNVRPATFTKERVVAKVEDLAARYSTSDAFGKLCTLFSDMYKDGDMDLRSVLTITLFNGLSDKAFENVKTNENISAELSKDMQFTRKLKGKKIKPEKKKKEKKVVARLDDRR